MVLPSQTVPVVSTRSRIAATRYSSGSVPPSVLIMVLRWNPVAIFCSGVASGSRSPATCSMVNRSKGRSELMALITQSR